MRTNKSITILLQGHGVEKLDKIRFLNVNLLSFCGTIGEPGIMKFCEGEPLDIAMVKHVASLYKGITKSELQKEFYDNDDYLVESLKYMYENCGVSFPCGFRKTFPRNDRIFYFKPNGHENCKKCVKYGDNICIQERDHRKRLCPEYGLTVVTSSDPSDYRFTLAGKTDREETSIANWHMNLSTKTYWSRRAKDSKCQDIFDSIFENHRVFLSDVVTMFKDLGYDTIYILDPTCRNCAPVSKLKKAIHSVHETIEPKSSGLWEEMLPEIKNQISRKSQSTSRPIQVNEDRFVIKKEKNNWTICDKVAQTCAVVAAGTALYYYLSSIGVLPTIGMGTKRKRRVINNKKSSKRRA